MDVAEILEILGDPGIYQILLYLCLCLCNATTSMNHLVMAVYGYVPPHRCKVPVNQTLNAVIPPNEKCHVYKNFYNSSGSMLSCPSGFNFTLNGRETTISSEWSLVCEKKHLVNLVTTIYFTGVMVGGLLCGQLSDKFGRRPILLICLYGYILLGSALYFAPTFEAFASIRFFIGFLAQGLQTSSYVLLVEMTALKYRPICSGLFEIFWAIGNIWMTTLAWIIQDWRSIQLALCLPSLATVFYIVFVPESFSWLILNNKFDQAKKNIKKISSFNRKEFPNEVCFNNNCRGNKTDVKSYSLRDLFLYKNLRKRTILMGYIWLASSIVYYGLSLSAGDLAGNRFHNLFISAAVELVAFISVMFILKYFSRRRPLMLYYLFSGVTCIIAGLLPTQGIAYGENLAKGFAILGKLFISAGFSTIFLFTVELFPTVVRSIGMGSCVFWARAGGMIAPQILLMGKYTFTALPFVIFGALSLLAAIAAYFVPETGGSKLSQTIEEIESQPKRSASVTSDTISNTAL